MLDPMVDHKGRLPKAHTGWNSRKRCLFTLYPTLFYPRFEPLRLLTIVAANSTAEGISLAAAFLRHQASRDHRACPSEPASCNVQLPDELQKLLLSLADRTRIHQPLIIAQLPQSPHVLSRIFGQGSDGRPPPSCPLGTCCALEKPDWN